MSIEEVEMSKFDQGQLLKSSTTFYTLIAAVGLMIAHFKYDSLATAWSFDTQNYPWWKLGLIGFLAAGVISIMSYLLEDFFPSYNLIKEIMISLMGRLSLSGALYLAILSAVAEEILFRMAIQPSAGLVLTSLLFALLHLGPRNQIGAWSLMAFLSGLLLGWAFESTGSLWPPIIAHSAVNIISLQRFRSLYKLHKLAAEEKERMRKKFRGAE